MKASFGQPIVSKFKGSKTIWMDDANYKDYSGVATFTAGETKAITSELAKIGSLFQSMNSITLNAISNDDDLLMLVKTYNNTKIRSGELIKDTSAHVTGLFDFIHNRFQKEIDSKKTEKGKSVQEEKRKKILAFFANHDKREIVKIFDLANKLTEVKNKIVSKMNEASNINTFLKTSTGFRVTGVEGFVAIDHLSGGAVKIVNRMEFSKANFSPEIIKGWQR